jgi:hypothetical protein
MKITCAAIGLSPMLSRCAVVQLARDIDVLRQFNVFSPRALASACNPAYP